MHCGGPKTPIRELRKAPHASWRFFGRTGIRGGILGEYIYRMQPNDVAQKGKSACKFSSDRATAGVRATGALGALSKARQTSRCSKTSSTQVSKCRLSPSDSKTRRNCCADPWPQLTCNFVAIFLGSDWQPFNASPKVTALHTEIARGGSN